MRVIAISVIILSAIVVFLQARFCLANDYGEWLDRCEAHRASVERILAEEDISTDYYYLMVAESKCTPEAESDKGAQGPWQLMPATARHYGCDDPHDLECATRAAAAYIRHLEDMFNDSFADVVIAYNMGGRNYKRMGATAEAKGLLWTVQRIKANDERTTDNQT